MPTLRELQRSFAAALHEGAEAALLPLLRAGSLDGCERIGVYRHQLRQGFCRALALEFPVIERLVGSAYFARLAADFQRSHPSRTGDLHHIGAPFAAFLAARLGGGAYDYLAHVARLEWAVQECLRAPDAGPFDPRALRGLPARCYAQLRFALHPACRVLNSPYPIVAIWRANHRAAEPVEIIALNDGPARVLVQRSAGGIELHEFGAAEFALLEKIAQDCCLGAALEAAQQVEMNFDPGPLLRSAVGWGALSSARVPAAARAKRHARSACRLRRSEP